MKRILAIFVFALFVFSACAEPPVDAPVDPEQEVLLRADQVIELMASVENIADLAPYVHPEKGVRFSPYVYVQEDSDLVFSAEELGNLQLSDQYEWGVYDGSGFPIELSVEGYWQKFVYAADYLEAEPIYNEIVSRGTLINNTQEVYDAAVFVDYYVPGSEQYGGMDWRSLRLFFEPYEGEFYLVGVVNDQWTT